jgi:hypothetical protein
MRANAGGLLPLLLGAWLAIGAEKAASEVERVALVIGNASYQHTSPLANPKHDASDVAAILKGLDFHVVEGLDLSKTGMERIIRDFAEALAAAKVGLFFYAGHGLQVSGENYLVPVDAKLSTAAALDFEMIRLALVQRVMERAAETNIIFLDACRDNPLARNLARAMGSRSAAIGRGLAVMESGVGTLISFSTQPGNVALDGIGRNSPFAGALIEVIRTSREDLSTILIDVRNKVMAETGSRQVPWEHSALTGRFYFNPAAKGQGAGQVNILPGIPPSPRGERESRILFEGDWLMSAKGNCPNRTFEVALTVAAAKISGWKGRLKGDVTADAGFKFTMPSRRLREIGTFIGKFEGNGGKGTFRYPKCAGSFTLKKMAW